MSDEDALLTDRLRLPRWREADGALLARLAADPEVVRYVGAGEPWPPERSVQSAAGILEHWRAHGFGWRPLVETLTGVPVGVIMLMFAGEGSGVDPAEYEIGWWLEPIAWGRGLALEGARAVMAEAFERVGAPSLVARIQPANQSSRRLAERLGMELEGETRGRFGEPALVYRVRSPCPAR